MIWNALYLMNHVDYMTHCACCSVYVLYTDIACMHLRAVCNILRITYIINPLFHQCWLYLCIIFRFSFRWRSEMLLNIKATGIPQVVNLHSDRSWTGMGTVGPEQLTQNACMVSWIARGNFWFAVNFTFWLQATRQTISVYKYLCQIAP